MKNLSCLHLHSIHSKLLETLNPCNDQIKHATIFPKAYSYQVTNATCKDKIKFLALISQASVVRTKNVPRLKSIIKGGNEMHNYPSFDNCHLTYNFPFKSIRISLTFLNIKVVKCLGQELSLLLQNQCSKKDIKP